MGMARLLVIGTVHALLGVVQLCMLVRAILSWFPVREDHPIATFTCMVTEPVIRPIRALFERMHWFENMPIDMSFLVAYLLLTVVESVLLAVG